MTKKSASSGWGCPRFDESLCTARGLARAGNKMFRKFWFAAITVPIFLELCIHASVVSRQREIGPVLNDAAMVKVSAVKKGQTTHFYVENQECGEVTMTFNLSLENLRADVAFPYTATFKPGETEAFQFSPINSNTEWNYSYTNYYKLGSSVAVPDDYVYSLPYPSGNAYRVTQGYGGRFSHTGANQFAIDWKMPEGTPVLAARGGLVVKTKDDSNRGGSRPEYDRFNNYVLIRHDDGTLGQYCHLRKGSVKVAPGQFVRAGDLIALSGNTGFSDGAHLHFCVFKTRDGRERESIPIKFKDAAGQAITLVEGRKYKAPEAMPGKSLSAQHQIQARRN
jgi:murein DD-endopeptidase MepM/ murein hydrolase activator NlpD